MTPLARRALLAPLVLASNAVRRPRAAAAAEPWPTQPISIVVPFAPGPIDAVARLLAEAMSRHLGVPVVVENVAGAGGTVGAERVARSRPDGQRLLLHNIGMATAPTLYRRLPWDPLTSFEAIGLVNPNPMLWIARPDFSGATLGEMAAFLRARGEGANLAHAGLGSSSQLCAMLMQAALGVAATQVVFRSSGEVFPNLTAGRVDLYCDQVTSALGQVQAGAVKAIAVTADARLPGLPAVPTTAEGGMPEFRLSVWHGLYAPARTPGPVVRRLNGALRAALADPRVVARMTELGTAPEPMERVTPEAHRAHLADEIERWRPVLTAAGQYAD